MQVKIIDHPLIQHKLTLIRDVRTGPKEFRELLDEVAMLMAYEITRNLPLEEVQVETPVAPCTCKVLAGKKIGVVPILRAGLGIVNGFLRLIPAAKVGHVGLYRDPETLQHIRIKGLFPAGEGSGYSGGITSSAIDGENCAQKASEYIRNIK